MKKYCQKPTGEIPGSMGSTTKHMTETNMGNSMKGVSQGSLSSGTTMKASIERNVFERANIPGVDRYGV